jgi:micrococcal nuclease
MRSSPSPAIVCSLIVAGLLLLFAASWAWAATAPFSGRVVGIADGDTLTVLAGEVPHRVRLAQIDAPEKKQPWGERSRQSLADLCFGQQVRVSPGKTDLYGRTVARVRCGSEDASLHQVQNGLAWAYTAYLTDPAIAVAETLARDTCTGLWADLDPVPPWLFRKEKR